MSVGVKTKLTAAATQNLFEKQSLAHTHTQTKAWVVLSKWKGISTIIVSDMSSVGWSCPPSLHSSSDGSFFKSCAINWNKHAYLRKNVKSKLLWCVISSCQIKYFTLLEASLTSRDFVDVGLFFFYFLHLLFIRKSKSSFDLLHS